MRQTRKRKKPLEPESARAASSKAKKSVQATDPKTTVGKAPANPDARSSRSFVVVEEGDQGATAHIDVRINTSILALKRKAAETLGENAIPNLMAIGEEVCVVYLPVNLQLEHLQEVSKRLLSYIPIQFKSLPGLRSELAKLAEAWELPLDKDDSLEIPAIRQDSGDGWVVDPPEILTFARLALAANEAVRRDCQLRLVGNAKLTDENQNEIGSRARDVDPAYETFPSYVKIDDYNSFIDSLIKDR